MRTFKIGRASQIILVVAVAFLTSKAWLILVASSGWSFISVLAKSILYNIWAMTSSRCWVYAGLGVLYVAREEFKHRQKNGCPSTRRQALVDTFKNVLWIADPVHWVCGIAGAINLTIFTLGVRLGNTGIVCFLNSGAMFVIAFLSEKYLQHKPTRREWQIVGVGFCGMAVLAWDGFSSALGHTQNDLLIGTILGATCAFTLAVSLIGLKLRSRAGVRGTEGLESCILACLFPAVILSPCLALAGLPRWQDVLLIVALAGGASLLPDILYVKAIRGKTGVPLVNAVVISRLSPVLSPVWTWKFLGETFSRTGVFGAFIVTVSVVLQAIVQKTEEEKEEEKGMGQRWEEHTYEEPWGPVDPDFLCGLINAANREREAFDPDGRIAYADENIDSLLARYYQRDNPLEYQPS